ncbi:MAG: AAA family ATPase [Candidatus Aminicenantes bacterium]|nr:AAA family ATPase [Candidatus Aminicenantes bacterium]
MKIKSIYLRNWRCFSSAGFPVKSRLIITGPCGSGKTSLLEAICFLRDLARGQSLEEVVDRRGGLSHLRNLEARYPETDIILMLYLRDRERRDWIYRLKFGEEGSTLIIKEELIWKNSTLLMRRPDKEDKKNPIRKKESCLSPRLIPASLELLASFMRTFHYENPSPELLRNQDLIKPQDLLIRIAQTPDRLRKIRLSRISEVIKRLIEGFGQLKVERDFFGRWHLSVSCQHWRPRVSWQSWDQWPDGAIRLFSIFWSILEKDTPILIEEPEIGLHPEAVSNLPRLMRELTKRSHRPPQLIITTHHPSIIKDRLIKPAEIVLLIPDKPGTKVAVGWPKDLVINFLENKATLTEEMKARLKAEEQPCLPLFSEPMSRRK